MSEGQAAAQLHAVGAMLGVEVTVADGEEWHVDARGLRVGLDWYLRRGHGEREAVAQMHMAIEDAAGSESLAGVVPAANRK